LVGLSHFNEGPGQTTAFGKGVADPIDLDRRLCTLLRPSLIPAGKVRKRGMKGRPPDKREWLVWAPSGDLRRDPLQMGGRVE